MALFISNRNTDIINVVLSTLDNSCGAWPWRKRAWWVIPPGQTIIPNALGMPLNTVNRFAYLYAFSASGDKEWRDDNFLVNVSTGVHFDQCEVDNTNCPRRVGEVQMDFAGNPNIVMYVGPNAGQTDLRPPGIAVTPGHGAFFISGRGFSSGGQVSVVYNYFPVSGGVTTNSGSPAIVSVSSDGTFTSIISVSTLLYPGHIDVRATDTRFSALSATTSVSF
jgi:uncharacterized membrane protein